MKCDNCTEKCPQEELACEIAKGRMYATNEVIRLQKELKEIRSKAIDEFFEELQKYEDDDMWLRLKMSSIYEIAEQMKGSAE